MNSNPRPSPHRSPRRDHWRQRRWAPLITALGFVALIPGLASTAGAASASPASASSLATSSPPVIANTLPGDPGNPQAGTVIYQEDFENGLTSEALELESYKGSAAAHDQSYTAADQYLTSATPADGLCNGWIRNYNSPIPGYTSGYLGKNLYGCGDKLAVEKPPVWDLNGDDLVSTVNQLRGLPAKGSNAVLTGFTSGPTAAGTVVETVPKLKPIPVSSGRYYAMSAVAATVQCGWFSPKLDFALVANGVEKPVFSGFDACTAPGGVSHPTSDRNVRAARMVSDTAALVPATGTPTLGLRVSNQIATNGNGNDFALDDLQIIDVTPQMDQSFVSNGISSGSRSKMTITITNTSDLAAKPNWSFVNQLPAGLRFHAQDDLTINCGPGSQAVPDRVAGTLTVSGSLDKGKKSCAVSIMVTGDTPGTYTNTAANFTWIEGVNPPGSASLTVLEGPNKAPIAFASTVNVYKGTEVPVPLYGEDPEGGPLTCTITPTTEQLKGVVGGSGCARTFTANPREPSGNDAFSFRVTDDKGLQSGWVKVSLKVVNRVPVATDQGRTVAAGASVSFTLGGVDEDPTETASLVCSPKLGNTALGKVAGSGCDVTYTAGTATGSDSLTFTVNDGFGGVATGTVRITIGSPLDQAPTANALAVTANKGQPKSFTLTGTDPEGGPLTCVVPASTQQGKGTIGGTGCNRTYTADAGTSGTDSFTFTVVDDKGLSSGTATVTVTIANRVPMATDLNVTVGRGERVSLTLLGTDPDPGETLTLACDPKKGTVALGTVTGFGCFPTYTAGDSAGADSFTFTMSDAFGGVATGTVRVTVTDPVLPGCSSSDSQNARYVCKVYLDLLGRGADPSGKAFWLRKVDRGESRAGIIRKYQSTPEYRRRVVDDVFVTLLRRTPNSSEQANWVDKLGSGINPDEIRMSVLGGAEFYGLAGGAPEEFAAAMYQQVTRVPAALAQIDSVVTKIEAGQSRSSIARELLASREGDTAVVQGMYAKYLRRTAPSGEVTYWVNKLQSGVTELKIVEATVSSNEYLTHA